MAAESGFKSPRVRGQVVQLWLVGGILADLVYGVLSVIHLGLIDDDYTTPARLEEVAASEDRLAVVGIAVLVVFLVTAAFWIAWFHRSYKNLPALGCPDRRHRTGWAIGGWFIPIVSWIIPKRITDDLWRCSVETHAPPELHWQRRRVPGWVHFWWFLFILGSLLGNASYRIYGEGDDIGRERLSTLIDIIATPVYVAAAVLAWRLVDRIGRAQEERGA